MAVAFGLVAYAYLTLPDVRPLARENPATTAFTELRALEAREHGKAPRQVQHWTQYDHISANITRAVLVAEDDAFWQHEGVDFEQLQESLEMDWARGRFIRGASTITQQLAKNLYLSPSRNPLRKFRELVIARRLEAELKKARILELYLNVIEWGDGIYGVDAAARTYFGASASAVSPEQAALLAGAIINPRVLNPAKPTARLLRRQQLILHRMGAVSPPSSDSPTPREGPTRDSTVHRNPEAQSTEQSSGESSGSDEPASEPPSSEELPSRESIEPPSR